MSTLAWSWPRKLITAFLALVFALIIISLGAVYYIGAWHILFPSSQHEAVPPTLPASLPGPTLLVFTKTNSFRHRDGISSGLELLQATSDRRGWSLFHTENGAIFNENQLGRFQGIVFLNTTGDTLSEQQQWAFQSWLQTGGGWLGIHAAGDGSHTAWPWYVETLIGATFTAHIMGPQFQQAKVISEQTQHPAMVDLPKDWIHEEEWYSWDKSPRGENFTILATIDENSYQPFQNIGGSSRDLSMGDHPVIWSRCVDWGRAIYSAMGHSAAAFDSPEHKQLLENALTWILAEHAAHPESDKCKAPGTM